MAGAGAGGDGTAAGFSPAKPTGPADAAATGAEEGPGASLIAVVRAPTNLPAAAIDVGASGPLGLLSAGFSPARSRSEDRSPCGSEVDGHAKSPRGAPQKSPREAAAQLRDQKKSILKSRGHASVRPGGTRGGGERTPAVDTAAVEEYEFCDDSDWESDNSEHFEGGLSPGNAGDIQKAMSRVQTIMSEVEPATKSGGRSTRKQKERSIAYISARKSRFQGGNFIAPRRHMASIAELAEEITDSSGALVDYILRYRARLRHGGKGGRWDKQYELDILSKLLNSLSLNDWAGFEYAGQQISMERLSTVIMTALTKEAKAFGIWKTMSVKDGAHSISYNIMLRRARQIRGWKREEAALRTEIDNWILRYKLLHNQVVPMQEDMWDRKARLDEFWGAFHGKKENPLDEELLAEGVRTANPRERRASVASTISDMGPQHSLALSPEAGLGRTFPTAGRPSVRSMQGVRDEPRASRSGQSERTMAVDGQFRLSTRDQQDPFPNSQQAGGMLPRTATGLTSRPHSQALQKRSGSKAKALTSQTCSLPNLHGGANKHGSNKTLTRKLWELSATTSEARKEEGKLPLLKGHQKRYLQECESYQRVPIPMAFVTGHSKKFEAAGRDLVDQELIAMAGMLHETTVIEVADLGSNSLLTDAGLVPFLQRLSKRPVVQTLQQLMLSNCARAGMRAMEGIMHLLSRASSLRVLDLSHVPLATRLQPRLCKAIGEHSFLETVNLTDTGILTCVARHCIGELLSSMNIRNLDLSWNCFSSDSFLCLGEQMVKNSALRSLKLTNCSATVEEGKDTPISLFLECLSRDTSLQKLDISMNRIDHQTFLIVEDALDKHPKMQELVVCHNTLGVLGIRSAMRLLARETNDLTKLQLEGCYNGAMANTSPGEGHEASFSATNPGGKYTLRLDRPCHRALLRLLYRITDKFGLSPDDAFTNVSFTPGGAMFRNAGKAGAFSHPQKDAEGLRVVPTSGVLQLVLNAQKCIEKSIPNLEDEQCEGFLAHYFQLMRYQVSVKKGIPLFAHWKMINGSMLQQQVFLDSLAKDFCITVPQLSVMCASSRLFAKDTIWRMMPCVPYDPASRFLGHMIVPSLGDFLWTHQRMQALLNFNAGNPTGHYKLNLDNCCDYAVAERLRLLDRWESVIDSRRQFFDTSKWGNKSHFRNELHRGHPVLSLGVASVAEWTTPESGEFEFDYNTNRRPSHKSVVSDELWDHVLMTVYDSTVHGDPLMKVLRRVSHNLALSSMHMRKMLGYFKSEEERAECFVMFFFRIVDICNAKIFSSRFANQQEVIKLQERLGYVSFFPFVQPENARFSLDFSHHDQRVCANLLITLSLKEKRENLRNPVLIHVDGTEDKLPQGVPATWQFLDKMPKEGHFSCNYVCAPEDRKYEPRRKNAEVYGYYTVDTAEADVMWWTGLLEVPEDVIKFMEFIMSNFSTTLAAFTAIDGADGNGEITFQEMAVGLQKLKFRKFEGKDEKERTMSVFRYLDPGGEGTISKQEWKILDQLWREFDLSVREFVQFMMLAFGEDLETVWSILDPMETGSLTLDQWMTAVEDIGYFGPASIVYALLDHSDDGEISYDEFAVLQKYAPESACKPINSETR